jgi:hypothetical protein
MSGTTPDGLPFSATLPLAVQVSVFIMLLPPVLPSQRAFERLRMPGELDGAGVLTAVAGDETNRAEVPVVLASKQAYLGYASPNLPIEEGLAGLSVTWTQANLWDTMRAALTVSATGQFTGAVGGIQASGTIEASGVLTMADPGYSIVSAPRDVAEGGTGTTAFIYTVTRLGDTTGISSVAWETREHHAIGYPLPDSAWQFGAQGTDFVGGVFPRGELTFLPGETQKTLTVEVAGDTLIEQDEWFTVSLPGSLYDVRNVAWEATSRIGNDDYAVFRIEAVDADLPEGEVGEVGDDRLHNSVATFRISRTGVEDQRVSVSWRVDGARDDFGLGISLPEDAVAFLPGETSHLVQVRVVGDAVPEGNDSYRVSLFDPRGGIVSGLPPLGAMALGLIINDDGGPSEVVDSTAADETFALGEGDDLVRFSAPQAQYRIGIRDNEVLVEGPDGTDTLVDVELLKFGTEPAMPLWVLQLSGAEEAMRYREGDGARHLLLPQRYEGPLDLDYIMGGDAQDSWLDGSGRNDFANLGDGNDAAQMWGGDDIVDGGGGNNFLTGGEGRDAFFLDGRFAEPVWSCISDWEIGESLTLWGWRPGISVGTWGESAGLPGYLGATFFADIDGSGAVETVVTFAGRTVAEMPAPVVMEVSGIGVLKFG